MTPKRPSASEHAELTDCLREFAQDLNYDIMPSVRGALESAANCIDALTAERDKLKAEAKVDLTLHAAIDTANAQYEQQVEKLQSDLSAALAAKEAAEKERDRLKRLLDTPEVDDFVDAVKREAAHQCERWGVDSDAGKTPQDWFWLIGYLAGKGLNAAITGDRDKALHHTVSTAAACLNWHAHMTGHRTAMRPGTDQAALKEPHE